MRPLLSLFAKPRLFFLLAVFLCFIFPTNSFAIQYWWRTAAPNNVWTDVNNWSTTGFAGAAAAAFPGAADEVIFGLLGDTPNPITFAGVPTIDVGIINANSLQVQIIFPAGVTLNIHQMGSFAGGNANITINPGATMRVLNGASISGAGGGHRWYIDGTFELQGNADVGASCMLFLPNSTLRYTGGMFGSSRNAGNAFLDGLTGTMYAGGFPGNIEINTVINANINFPNNAVIAGSTTILQGKINDGAGTTLTFGGNFTVNGATSTSARLVCSGGGTTIFNGTTNRLLQGEIWSAGTLTVNNILQIDGGVVALIGAATVNGTSYVNYRSFSAICSFQGPWTGSTTPQMFPPPPNPMYGEVQFGNSNITIGADVFFAGNVNNGVGAPNITIPAPRRVILGEGTLTLPTGRFDAQAGSTIEIRRPTLQAAWFVGNQVGNLEINTTANVALTNSLTVRNTLAMTNSGNLVLGPNTLEINSTAMPAFVGGGIGKINATNAASILRISSNPTLDGTYCLVPVQTLTSGTAAAALLGGTWSVNNFDLTNAGSFTATGTLTLNTGGSHTIGAGGGRTLFIASGGRVIVQNGATLTNNGAIDVGGAATLEIQDNGIVAGANDVNYTVSNAVLEYSGTMVKISTGREFPNTMNGSVRVANTGTILQAVGPTIKTVAGTFTFVGAGKYSINGGTGNQLILNGGVVNTGTSELQANDNSLTINSAVTNALRFGPAPNNTLRNFTLGAASGNFALGTPVVVNTLGILTMGGGNIATTLINSITVQNTAPAAVVRTAGMIIGPLTRDMAAAGTYLFPVGAGAAYLPFSIQNPGAIATVRVGAFNAGSGGVAGLGMAAGTLSTSEHWRTDILAGAWAGGQVIAERAANFPVGSSLARYDGVAPAGQLFSSIGPNTFPAAATTITSTSLAPPAPAATMFFATGLKSSATELRFLQQPSNVQQGAFMSPSVTIAATDAMGAVDNTFTGTVTLTAPNLVGSPVNVNLLNGAAVFSNLNFSATGTFQLTGTGPLPFNPSNISSMFTVTAPPNPIDCAMLPPPLNGYAGMDFVATNMSGFGRILTVSNVVLGGAGVMIGQTNRRFVQPNAALTLNFDVQMANIATPPCPGCVTAFYLGLGGGNSSTVTGATPGNIPPNAFEGIIASTGAAGPFPRNYTFNAPSTPGIYYLSITNSWDFFNSNPRAYSFGNTPATSIGYIAVGACSQSDIIPDAGFVANTAIPYVGFTGAVVNPASPDVWQLRLRDGSGATDADGINTRLTSLSVQINDPRGVIENLQLFDNANNPISGTVTPVANLANFTGLTIDALQGNVAGTLIRLKASYRTIPTVQTLDGASFNFTVNGASTAGATSSSQLAAPTAIIGPSANSVLNVVADRLSIVEQPPMTITTGATMRPSPVVHTVDINGNRDIDYVGAVTATNPKLTPSSPINTTATAGIAIFPTLRFLGAANATETVQFGPFMPINSTAFALVQPSISVAPAVSFINMGNLGLGQIRDTVITITASNVAQNGTAYFARSTPQISFSFPAIPLQQTPLTLVPAFTTSDAAGVTYTQQIRIRYQATAVGFDTARVQVNFGQALVSVIILGRGVNPNPFALSFTNRQNIYDSTGVPTRAIQNDVSMGNVAVSVFRQDSLWTPITAVRTITLTPLPIAGSTATFTINSQASITVPIFNSTSAVFSNVAIRWTNAPIVASTTPLLLHASTTEPAVFSTTISLVLSVGNTLPRITSFVPRYASPGQTVNITGTNFFNIQTVRFNGVNASSIQVLSPTLLRAVVPNIPNNPALDTGSVFISNGVFSDSLSRFEVARAPQIRSYFALENGVRRGFEENVQASGKAVRIIGRNFAPRYNTSESSLTPNVSFGNVPANFAFVLNDSTANASVGAGASGALEYQNLAGTTTASTAFIYLPPPEVASMSPLYAGLNQEITITGANFRVLDTVRLGSAIIPPSRYTIDNNFSRLRFLLRDTVSNAALTLVTTAGSTSSSQRFTYVPPPEIHSFSPDSGSFGTAISVTGRNFVQVQSVLVGGRPVAIVSPRSSTQLLVVAGAGFTGVESISITTPGGSTTSTQQFTFVNVPTVQSFQPKRGGPGTLVTVTGANFSRISEVSFGDIPARSFTVRSTTELVAVVDDPGATGQIRVSNFAGRGSSTEAFNFYFVPKITSFTPLQGATGTSITISGEFFIEVSTVTIGGVPVADFKVSEGREITALVSTGATGRIAVNNPGGTGQSNGIFRFIEPERPAAPFITNFSPDTAFVGDIVRVEGFNFINIRSVKLIGETVANFSVESPTQMTLIVPMLPQTTLGTLEITSTTGTGISKKLFVYAPPPRPLTPTEQDSLTLVQLFNATSGNDWVRQRGWLRAGVSIRDWQGVFIENGRVTRLNLDSTGLQGELPAAMSRLTALKSFSARTNALSGTFPQSLLLLPVLEEISLSDNQLRGTLPSGISSAKQLRIIRLDNNGFTGTLPSEWCDIQNADEISLAGNRLGGIISACLGRLTTLRRLDLSRNQFTGSIPTEFAALTNLRELSLTGNALDTPLPSTIWGNSTATISAQHLTKNNTSNSHASGMTALTRLDLSNNRIPGNIPVELRSLSRLETLLLNNNRFTGEIPSAFGDLVQLRELDLSANALTGQVPTRLADARALERIALTRNEFTGRIPSELGTLPNLRALALDSNRFAGALPESFTQLARLQSLRVNSNQLTSLPNVRRLTALTVLNVARNRLTFEHIEPNVRSGDVAFTYTFSPQDTVRVLRDTLVAIGFRFALALPMNTETNIYQWFKNGRAIPNSNNAVLSFANFARLDTGIYHCQITNSAARGLTLIVQAIRVGAAPSVIPQSAPVLLFPANATGNIPLDVAFTWDAVPGAGVYDVQIATDSAFTPSSGTNSAGSLIVDESVSSTQFRPTSAMLKNFTNYFWRVRARNEAGAGVWSAVNRFTTIQEGAVLSISAADLGRGIVRRQRVGKMTIQNILTQAVSIEAVSVTGRDASSFALRTNLVGMTLQPNEIVQADVVFQPQSVGAKQAEVLLSVSSGGATKEQRGVLRGTGSLLDVNDITFDTVVVSFQRFRTVKVLNLDNKATKITRISIPDPIFQRDESLTLPLTVGAGDSLNLLITASSNRTGTAETTISLGTDTGDSLLVQARAFFREPRQNDISATFILRALDSNVAPGGRVRMELAILDNKGSDVFRADEPTFTGEVMFNSNALVLDSAEQQLRALNTSNNEDFRRYIIPQTRWNQTSSIPNRVLEFQAVAVSGNTDSTRLFVNRIIWGTQKVNVSVSTMAIFRVNTCRAGGLRLTTTAERDKIVAIAPNPVRDVAEIAYTVREDGDIDLAIVNAQGKRVLTLADGIHAAGAHSIMLSVRELPSGTYFLVMRTPTSTVQQRLQLVR